MRVAAAECREVMAARQGFVYFDNRFRRILNRKARALACLHGEPRRVTPLLLREKNMADGQVVLVTTEPLDGGSPVRSVYFVAEQDPDTATAIIAAMMAPNEKVEAWGRLPEAAVKALGLKRGDFMHG
jgi:hypothetical protein